MDVCHTAVFVSLHSVMYRKYLKQGIDFAVALFGLFFLSPIFLILTLILSIEHKGKPFFFHTRPGKNGKLFILMKFRTMNEKKDTTDQSRPDRQRITPLGNFLRRTSLDELPNLCNVLKGEMSLVGPRPLMPEYLSCYNTEQARRHDVLPGITGWAQINGRNAITWKQKFELDVWYVDNLSFQLDVKILFLTLKNIVRSKNVNASDEFTMEWFNGNN